MGERKVHTCGGWGGSKTLCGIQLTKKVPSGRDEIGWRRTKAGLAEVKISSRASDVTCINCWDCSE